MNRNGTPAAAKLRGGERGAALITALLVSTMLLMTGGALLTFATRTNLNAVHATAEAQAYYGAEAGLQDALNALRGNVAPNPLFAPNPSGGIAVENKLSYRKAVTRATSNLPTDPLTFPDGAPFPARLSRWVRYNYTPPGGSYPDRVTVSTNYTPASGIAFSVVVSDPDDPTGDKRLASPTYQPSRLLVTATGYGPRGAVKRMDLLVDRFRFGIAPPAPIVIRGADDPSSYMTFELGSSSAKKYSGEDRAKSEAQRPTVAVKLHDKDVALAGMTKGATIADPKLSILDIDSAPGGLPSAATPPFLATANAARAFLGQAESLAKRMGRYFTSFNGYAGSAALPAFTFVDGTCQLEGGAGLLVVTGDLVLRGNDGFDGIILVLGNGKVTRSGGGGGGTYGAFMIAKFNRTSGGFLAPHFDVSGGGGSTIQYDSLSVITANSVGGRPSTGWVEALAR